MTDDRIGQNRNVNKLRAAFVAIIGLMPLILAAQMATFLRFDEY